jgi:hypothetical protein
MPGTAARPSDWRTAPAGQWSWRAGLHFFDPCTGADGAIAAGRSYFTGSDGGMQPTHAMNGRHRSTY